MTYPFTHTTEISLGFEQDFRWYKPSKGQRAWRVEGKTSDEPAWSKMAVVLLRLLDSRADVQAFLGFRHVTGIKEWNPAEKAQYIAHLIEDGKMTYEHVMRQIGSKTPTVRQNYITYRLLLQMEGQEEISVERVEQKFSVLYLSLRTIGVRKYLQIDLEADPRRARTPVPKSHLEALQRFALWLFGDDKTSPIVRDSRQVDEFRDISARRSLLRRNRLPPNGKAQRRSTRRLSKHSKTWPPNNLKLNDLA